MMVLALRIHLDHRLRRTCLVNSRISTWETYERFGREGLTCKIVHRGRPVGLPRYAPSSRLDRFPLEDMDSPALGREYIMDG